MISIEARNKSFCAQVVSSYIVPVSALEPLALQAADKCCYKRQPRSGNKKNLNYPRRITTMTVTELKKFLRRGVQVTVRETFDNVDLHNLTLYVKSKKPAVCKKQPGQCAEDRRCVGLSVFVCKEDPLVDTGKSRAGWRAGAHKVCLSHLTTVEGEPLLKERKVKTKKVDPEITSEEFSNPAVIETVTWDALAHVAKAAQDGAKKSGLEAVTNLIRLSRSLMTTTTQTRAKLINAQEKLLAVQEHALRELMGVVEPQAVDQEESATEEKVTMGFSPVPVVEEKKEELA